MIALADDPTAAAVLSAVPCYPVPPSGRSPAIDALRSAQAGQGLAIGQDGVLLILRRPWLELDVPVSAAISAYLPYGNTGQPRADLRCELIPAEHLVRICPQSGISALVSAAAEATLNRCSPARLKPG